MGRAERRAYAKRMNGLGYKGEKCPICGLNAEFIVAEEKVHTGKMDAYCTRCGKALVVDLQRPAGSIMTLKEIAAAVNDGNPSPLLSETMKVVQDYPGEDTRMIAITKAFMLLCEKLYFEMEPTKTETLTEQTSTPTIAATSGQGMTCIHVDAGMHKAFDLDALKKIVEAGDNPKEIAQAVYLPKSV